MSDADAAGSAATAAASAEPRTLEEIDAHLSDLATERDKVAEVARTRVREISDEIKKMQQKRRRVEAENEGIYRFSDDNMNEVLKIDDVWRVIGSVGQALRDDAECKRHVKCMNAKCRFYLDGVKPARRVPLLHVPIDATHSFCLVVCEFCRPHAYALLANTDYYHTHKDVWDGYGASTDFYAKPFCVMPRSRITSEAARETLDRLNERKR